MPRYKQRSQENILAPINLSEQLLPGTFEFTLNELIDNQIDLNLFDRFYNNDEKGPKAYEPAILIKVILYAYSKGILSSREIEHACRTNIIFMALSGDSAPDHSTIAAFISKRSEDIKMIFTQVLKICYQLDLIGLEYFAVDGCKLPSNAAKEGSGTFKDFKKKIEKLDKRIKDLIRQHKECDCKPDRETTKKTIEKIRKQKERIESFMRENEPRKGSRGKEIKSNITDNESAKLKTGEGYIQGFNGLAVADAKNQIIINAFPIGKQYEGGSLPLLLKDTIDTGKKSGMLKKDIRAATFLADTNYFSEENCSFMLKKEKLKAIIPDTQFRRRDIRFPDVKPAYSRKKKFSVNDFTYDKKHDQFTCPNDKLLPYYSKSTAGPYKGIKYRADLHDCSECPYREKCLSKGSSCRHLFITNASSAHKPSTKQMMDIIDSPKGRSDYSKRMGIIEPVFGNIKHSKKMNRFTMRSLKKISIQWFYYCLVHNIEKLCTTGAIDRLVMAG